MGGNQNFKTQIQEQLDKRKKEEEIYSSGKINGKKIYPFVRCIWSDGHEHAFSYAHLNTVKYSMEEAKNVIEAQFSKHEVTIKGYKLYTFYLGMLNHTVSELRQVDERYASLNVADEPMVTDIAVKEF